MAEVHKSKDSAISLEKALDLLEAFSPDNRTLSIAELSRKVGIPKSTAHRLLVTLKARGYIGQDEMNRQYRLGIKAWELGCRAVANVGIREVAKPYLEALAQKSAEIIHLAILDGDEVVYIDKVETNQHTVRAYTYLGGRAPAYCVATGKAILANKRTDFLASFLRGNFEAHTPKTLADPKELRADLEKTRRCGYAVNLGEWRIDVGGVAAPIWRHTNEVVAAVGVTAPVTRLTRGRVRELIPLVVETAHQISRDLGFTQKLDQAI